MCRPRAAKAAYKVMMHLKLLDKHQFLDGAHLDGKGPWNLCFTGLASGLTHGWQSLSTHGRSAECYPWTVGALLPMDGYWKLGTHGRLMALPMDCLRETHGRSIPRRTVRGLLVSVSLLWAFLQFIFSSEEISEPFFSSEVFFRPLLGSVVFVSHNTWCSQ